MEQIVTYTNGCFYISENFLHLYNTSINLATINNISHFQFPRRSIFANIKLWLYGLLIMVIISLFKKIYLLGDLYIYSIFILLIYNIIKARKKYYGLSIEMSNGKTIYIKSEKIDFIIEIENTILKSMNNKKSNYTINLNTQQIINNVKNNKGIISNGNKNTNKMKGNKYD